MKMLEQLFLGDIPSGYSGIDYNAKRKYVLSRDSTEKYFQISVNDSILKIFGTYASELWRIKSLFVKEPTTIAWLNKFRRGCKFVDIGANIGLYSLYASQVMGAKVSSFEVSPANLYRLILNVNLNGAQDRVDVFGVGLGKTATILPLKLNGLGVGFANHSFPAAEKDADAPFDNRLSDAKDLVHLQAHSLDWLISEGQVSLPNHIKIDVDGIESDILDGMSNTLALPSLETVLVEIDFSIDRSLQIVQLMVDKGWSFSEDQICVTQASNTDVNHVYDMMDRKEGGRNFIFFKDPAYFEYFKTYRKGFIPSNPDVDETSVLESYRSALRRAGKSMLNKILG